MLRLLCSFPTFYKYLLPTLMYGKDNVDLEEFTSILLSEERRLGGGSNEVSNASALIVGN